MSEQEYELDDDLKAFVEERLGRPFENSDQPVDEPEVDEPEPDETDASEPTEDDPGTGDQEPDETGSEGPTEGDTESSQGSIISLAPGVAITREQALSYYQLEATMRERPDVAEELKRLIGTPKQQETTAPTLPTIPKPDEYADENTKTMYAAYQAQQEYLTNLQKEVEQLRDVTINRDREEIISLIQSTSESFAASHKLSKEEMKRVQDTAERMNVLPSLMRGVDPITGETGPRDRTTALNRAYEIAYWYLPETREKAMVEKVGERSARTRKKQRLAGISGSSGSMPKEPPAPKNEQERRNAMISEVAQAMGFTHED